MIERVHNVAKSGKREAHSTDKPTPKRGRPASSHSLSDRYPPIASYESGGSNDEDSQALVVELAKERPRKDTVLPLMKRTFCMRRQFIVTDSCVPVSAMVAKFKGLSPMYVVSFSTF